MAEYATLNRTARIGAITLTRGELVELLPCADNEWAIIDVGTGDGLCIPGQWLTVHGADESKPALLS